MDATITKGTWIDFHPLQMRPGLKTQGWFVQASPQGAALGNVVWYSPWRRYCFWPARDTVFEQTCLREIADFCEKRTREHKERRT